MSVFTLAGGKGGVGKTTTAINTAVALQDIGHDTVVVDADLGMANLAAMLDIDHSPTLHDVLVGDAPITAATTTGPGHITVVPGERTLGALAEVDPANLRPVIDQLARRTEIVLVDTGAGLSHEATVPLGLADGTLLVTTDDDTAIRATEKTATLARQVDGTVLGTVLTRATETTNVSAVATTLDLDVLAVVPEDTTATRKEPLVRTHPDSFAADAYRRLAATLGEIHTTPPEPETTDESGSEAGS